MEQEKNNSAVATKVIQKVSTKTKVLLGLVIVFSIAGMFGLAGLGTRDITKNSAPIDPRVPGHNIPGYLGADLRNMFNGTGMLGVTQVGESPIVPGGTPLAGGVDDFNAGGGNPPTDRYTASWTQCTNTNNYCGTGNNYAQAKDNNTQLIWSFPCLGVGCSSSGISATGTQYTWNSSGEYNDNKTAQQLCSALGTGWYLPHQKQLMQAYIDGSCGNLDYKFTIAYWSSSVNVFNFHYYVGLCNGISSFEGSNITGIINDDGLDAYDGNNARVRCVHY